MSRIRDIARVTMREARGTERVEDKAWLVWRSIRTGIEQAKAPRVEAFGTFEVRKGVDGYRVKVSLNQVILALWPEWSMLDKSELSDVTQPIYAYLKTSGNAVCVQNPGKNSGTVPVWWVRDEWFGGQAIVVPQTHHPRERSAGVDRRPTPEERLTPHEAGEDREPAPVVVTKPEPEPDKKRPRPAQHIMDKFIAAREEARAQRAEEYRQTIIDDLCAADGWVASTVLAARIGHDRTVVKRHLDRFVEDGLVERGKRVKEGTLYRAVGASDRIGGQSAPETDKSDIQPTAGSTSPATADGDVVDMGATPLPAGSLSAQIAELERRAAEAEGLDVSRLKRERDDAVLRADLLAAEVRTLKAKLARFKKLLED